MINAPTVEVFWVLHIERMASFEFDRIIDGFTRYRTGHSLVDPQSLTNQSLRRLHETYFGHGHLCNALTIRWVLTNTDASC
ncbi:hypothetical protein OAH97_01145 [Octadecabacter sp.]|nr:hypothetical protein [Octadecabacter sp.]